MARPLKQGIDYSNWEVDMFDNDSKIDKLLDALGASGFLIYFYLCQRVYGSNGYFFKWNCTDASSTARKIGADIKSDTVIKTVDVCLQVGLFDKALFDSDGILTSRGIQRRYWRMLKDRTERPIIEKYWLLSPTESAGVILCAQDGSLIPPKPNYQPSKLDYHEPNQIKVNQSKSKQSKSKQSKSSESETLAHTQNIINPAPLLSDIRILCQEKNYKLNPELFFSHYEARNWLDKNAQTIKNWPALLDAWENREYQFPAAKKPLQAVPAQTAGSSIDIDDLDKFIKSQFSD